MSTEQNLGVKGSEETLRRKGRTKLGCCLMGCALPIGAVMLLVIAFFVWRARSQAEIREIEASITARGEPINAEELNTYYIESARGKDKTQLFIALTPLLDNKEFLDGVSNLPIVGTADVEMVVDPAKPFNEEEAVRQFFVNNAELMKAIEEAGLAEGDVRFPYDFREGFTMLIPHVQSMRGAARLLDLQARFAVREGETDKAFRSLRAIFGVSEALEAEPILVSQLVRIAIRGVAEHAICDLLPLADFSDEQLQQLKDDCLESDWRNAATNALVGERAIARVVFTHPAGMGPEFSNLHLITTPEDERFYLQFMTDSVAATDQDFSEMLSELERLEDELTNLSQFQQISHPLSSLITPAIASAINAFATAEARDQATAAQLAIELYRRKNGEPPATLDDLVPDFLPIVPVDPFSKKPLIYRFDEKEIIVYSVGRNMVDDGGTDEEQDMIMRVERNGKE